MQKRRRTRRRFEDEWDQNQLSSSVSRFSSCSWEYRVTNARLPNAEVAPIHPKAMPVILHPEDYERWLTDSYASVCELAQPFPSQLLTVA